MQYARLAFAALAWTMAAMVVIQVFWAGMALFGTGDFSLHREFGYWLSGLPLLILIAAFVARAGRATILHVAALFVVTFVQTILPILRADLPVVAALHPPTALLIFWMTLGTARRATALVRADRRGAEAVQEGTSPG